MDKFLDGRTIIQDSGSPSFVNQKNLFNLSQEIRTESKKVVDANTPVEKMQVRLPLVNTGTTLSATSDLPSTLVDATEGGWVVKKVVLAVNQDGADASDYTVAIGAENIEMSIPSLSFEAVSTTEIQLSAAVHPIRAEVVSVGASAPSGLTLLINLEKTA